jgi:2-oxoglutarate ferredoxin oxidoreductase subunit beta
MEDTSGYPVKMAEIMAQLPGVGYSERVTVNTPARINACKKALKKAFEMQLSGNKGMGFVEVLSPCPTGWSMSPVKSMEWIDEKMTEVYPLGVVKDVSKEETQA